MKYEIIDAHTHIFPQKIVEKAVKSIGNFYGLDMEMDGVDTNLIEEGKKYGISKYVVSSTATVKEQVTAINKFILSEKTVHPEFIGLITLHQDLTEKEIDEQITFGKENGFKGIKLHPDFQKFNIDDEKVYKIYERAEGIFPILFHTGDERYDYSNPCRLARVAKKFKKLKCVGAHFGGYSAWEKVDCYSGLENVYFDTSSSLFKIDKKRALFLLNELGKDRFMFGTDFPMWNAEKELHRFFDLDLSDEDNKNILSENAKRIYDL